MNDLLDLVCDLHAAVLTLVVTLGASQVLVEMVRLAILDLNSDGMGNALYGIISSMFV